MLARDSDMGFLSVCLCDTLSYYDQTNAYSIKNSYGVARTSF